MEEAHIIRAPDSIFESKTQDRTKFIKQEDGLQFNTIKVVCGDGIQVYKEGALYPDKGLVTPEAMWECNIAKRTLIEFMKLPKWLFITRASRQRLLDSYNMIAHKAMATCLLEYKYQMPITQEIFYIVKSFLIGIGMTEQSSIDFAKYFSHLIEYDNAYRYVAQDAFSETSKEQLLDSPLIEIDRLLLTLESRGMPGVMEKFRKIGNMVMLLLLVPKYFHLFRDIISKSRFEKLQYDDADKYWVSFRNEYKYRGMTQDQRLKLIDYKIPPYKKNSELNINE